MPENRCRACGGNYRGGGPFSCVCPADRCMCCNGDVYDPDELKPCAGCQRRCCADCLTTLGGERYCKECGVCGLTIPERGFLEDEDYIQERLCGEPATEACEECGRLICADHLDVEADKASRLGRTVCKDCTSKERITVQIYGKAVSK